MLFKTLTGSSKRVKSPKKYLIEWDSSSKSKMQFNVKQYLKKYWSHDIVFEEFPLAGSKMTFDFYNPNKNIIVEVQGGQHLKHTPFFHGKSKSNFLNQIKRDNDKQTFCELNNIKLVEIFPDDELSIDLFKSFGVIL